MGHKGLDRYWFHGVSAGQGGKVEELRGGSGNSWGRGSPDGFGQGPDRRKSSVGRYTVMRRTVDVVNAGFGGPMVEQVRRDTGCRFYGHDTEIKINRDRALVRLGKRRFNTELVLGRAQVGYAEQTRGGIAEAIKREFGDVIQDELEGLRTFPWVKQYIPLTDSSPVYKKPYRHPYAMREEIRTQLEEMLRAGIIRHSASPFSSPLWVVPKRDHGEGKPKFRVVDVLDTLAGATIFSVIDLKSGYHQIEVAEEDKSKTAFTFERGHYEYNRMPFGLRNAPATFQRLMDAVLKPLGMGFVQRYMDDLIIFSKSKKEHLDHLRAVFRRLREAGLTASTSKSKIALESIDFLESEVCKPLTAALQKNGNVKDVKGFGEALKQVTDILCRLPTLSYPDFRLPFEICTDASDIALGAVLYSERKTSLVWMESMAERSPKIARWKEALRNYEFVVKYREGKSNVVADYLSRPILVNCQDSDSEDPWGFEPLPETEVNVESAEQPEQGTENSTDGQRYSGPRLTDDIINKQRHQLWWQVGNNDTVHTRYDRWNYKRIIELRVPTTISTGGLRDLLTQHLIADKATYMYVPNQDLAARIWAAYEANFETIFGQTSLRPVRRRTVDAMNREEREQVFQEIKERVEAEKAARVARVNEPISNDALANIRPGDVLYKAANLTRRKGDRRFDGPFLIRDVLDHRRLQVEKVGRPGRLEVVHLRDCRVARGLEYTGHPGEDKDVSLSGPLQSSHDGAHTIPPTILFSVNTSVVQVPWELNLEPTVISACARKH
ncbi:hypothetical protein AAG570_002098 [Ranatra chinensis]|uniref:Reverse transcriptase domain-containing protein n=1 Tax=Ranatra chinensis TaxID=642074 RepID=A0ABD0YAF1_9HEMI